jgi:hypothetical protein
MKKALFSIFSLIYFVVASGVAVNIHYCMGQLSSVDYAYNKGNGDTCGKCGMENKKGCCHNESKFVKLTDDQQLAKAGITFEKPGTTINTTFLSFSIPAQGAEKSFALQYHSPPDPRLTSVYLHNSVFRI